MPLLMKGGSNSDAGRICWCFNRYLGNLGADSKLTEFSTSPVGSGSSPPCMSTLVAGRAEELVCEQQHSMNWRQL